MTPCARGCCWVPMAGVCAMARSCACHWADVRPATVSGGALATYRDPTSRQAIYNIETERRGT